MEKYFDTLKRCPLFAQIEAESLGKLLACLGAAVRSFSKGEFIFSAGDAISSVGVVLSGGVHVLQEDYWGHRTILAFVAPAQLFGEAFSCAEAESLPVSVQAAEDSEILLVDYSRITTTCPSACGFHSRLIQNMMRILAQKNILLTQKIEIVTHRTIRERLLAYLSAQAVAVGTSHFTIPFDRQELADYLAVDRSAMSAELTKMRAEGLIWTSRSAFELRGGDIR